MRRGELGGNRTLVHRVAAGVPKTIERARGSERRGSNPRPRNGRPRSCRWTTLARMPAPGRHGATGGNRTLKPRVALSVPRRRNRSQVVMRCVEPSTGVEPARSRVPCACPSEGASTACWWSRGGSNPLPLRCHRSALPSELRPLRRTVVDGWSDGDSNPDSYRARVEFSRLNDRPGCVKDGERAGREGVEPSRSGFGGRSVATTTPCVETVEPLRAAPTKGVEPSSPDRQSGRLTECVRGRGDANERTAWSPRQESNLHPDDLGGRRLTVRPRGENEAARGDLAGEFDMPE